MATLENVEILRQKANVTYEEAKAALDACGDDLLDAMIYMENQGKVAPPAGGGSYTSTEGASGVQAQPEFHHEEKKGESFSEVMNRFLRFCGRMLEKGNSNLFDVWRREEKVFSMPVTVLVILLILFFWVVLPLAIVGLFFGFRYRFSGQDLEGSIVNKAMDGAASAAESFKEELRAPKDEQK